MPTEEVLFPKGKRREQRELRCDLAPPGGIGLACGVVERVDTGLLSTPYLALPLLEGLLGLKFPRPIQSLPHTSIAQCLPHDQTSAQSLFFPPLVNQLTFP